MLTNRSQDATKDDCYCFCTASSASCFAHSTLILLASRVPLPLVFVLLRNIMVIVVVLLDMMHNRITTSSTCVVGQLCLSQLLQSQPPEAQPFHVRLRSFLEEKKIITILTISRPTYCWNNKYKYESLITIWIKLTKQGYPSNWLPSLCLLHNIKYILLEAIQVKSSQFIHPSYLFFAHMLF